MNTLYRFFVLFLFAPLFLCAKVTPEDGSALTYRIIGFSVPTSGDATNCKLQVAAGNYGNSDDFEKHIIITAPLKKNRAIAEVPDFGKVYTWRIVSEKDPVLSAKLYHFSTMTCPDVNPDSVRMRITLASDKYEGDYVFVDGNKVLYDMNGKPVWFFPKIENKRPSIIHLRDLTCTNFGTITAIVNGRLYEMNYSGDILWQAPDNSEISLDTTSPNGGYHHEFVRLPNGHYMAMGFEEPYWPLPERPDSSAFALWSSKIKQDANGYYQKMFFGTLLEYDEKGKLVWKWSGSDYFKTSDLCRRMMESKLFNVNNTHANAFYFDEKTKSIYISFKDINRIIQIRYPDKKVLHTFGSKYVPVNFRNRNLSNGVFCGQHSCRRSSDGNLYLFNNNICHRASLPGIVMLKEPAPGVDTIEKIWEFECPMGAGEQPQNGAFFFGGNVLEMPDNSFFVCMGGIYGKLFIVSRDKKILWSAQPEKWDSNTGQWIKDGVMLDNKLKEGSYRAHIITRAQLENVIWSEPVRK